MRTSTQPELPFGPAALSAADVALIDEQLGLCAAARELVPRSTTPCFGSMQLRTAGNTRHVLLGAATKLDGAVPLIDWRSAPLAEVFFAYDEGDSYELDVDGRTLAGTLVQRTLWTFDAQGELAAIRRGAIVFKRYADGWQRSHAAPFAFTPRDAHSRAKGPSAEITLDPAQASVVNLPASTSVLILGEAGFGKTTVALHRLRALVAQASPTFRAAVIVPTEGLRRLSKLLLERMGVENIEVWVYDRWVAALAHRVFPKLPEQESTDATAGVIRLKRHAALRTALREQARKKPRAPRQELLHLFGDKALMQQVLQASNGALGERIMADVLEHTHVQFSTPSERAYAHVDADRLATLDGLSLDAGTPMGDAGTIDVEDYTVLFELDRLRAEARGQRPAPPRSYDCILIDEAQDFAPLELALMGRCVGPKGTLIVAGDAGQQTNPTILFTSWPETMQELGCRDYESATLAVSYRCPDAVTHAARKVLDPTLDLPFAWGPALAGQRFDSECHLVSALIADLRRLREEDPTCTIALVCRTPEAAARLSGLVNRGLTVRLVRGGNFDFGAGINVTAVPEVKGLEFDYVILPDTSPAAYPDTAQSRRTLYVAMTRASHQLVLAAAETWSPLVQPSQGLS